MCSSHANSSYVFHPFKNTRLRFRHVQRRRKMLEVGGQAAEGSGIEARSGDQSTRANRGKKFSPSFFSYQDGLSWHIRVLY